MRFIESGPSIPDTLLRARDEGRVVFFCGAGISRARAKLPDFFDLAERVIHKLGAPEDCDAHKVLKKAQEIGNELDVTGLISADRVFSLLERDFTTQDIHHEVAKSLNPAADVDRSAHELLLRLAKTPSGKTQLVTTNFDRLFESGGNAIPLFHPPSLPQLTRCDDLNGIVYLHGRVNPEYTMAEGNAFVLSSSDFGHAYLSEGWATEFFREIVSQYVVVFVGYSADDPPVHYLLEGLKRSADSLHRIYAFQSDESAELIARWQHKGVEAIPYSAAEKHRALWDTLELWALRADNPQQWQQSVLDHAEEGPRNLKPFERGQVAHIVSTYEGAKAFAEKAPSAEWLCVFDPYCRYQRPEDVNWMNPDSPTVDPFSLYGLDQDATPQLNGDEFYNRKAETPEGAWDAFALNDLDRQELSLNNLPAVRGDLSANMPALPRRLLYFAAWMAKVVTQPAAIWWAARQNSLHPYYRESIERGLSQLQENVDKHIRNLWDYILESWNRSQTNHTRDWYNLKRDLQQNGWSLGRARRFVKLYDPYLKVSARWQFRTAPPTRDDRFCISDLVSVEVEYPVSPDDIGVPDEWLIHVVRGLRTNLEIAARLCDDVRDYGQMFIVPIVRGNCSGSSTYQRTHGLSGCVVRFVTLFETLIGVDSHHAISELATWPKDENIVFARLRFWASGKPELATPEAFAQVVCGLTDNVFWGSYHQRDLLTVLAARWSEIPENERRQIESRLMNGPPLLQNEEDDSYTKRSAWQVLQRLQWLKSCKCDFYEDIDSEIAKRRADAPEWKPEHSESAAESRESRGGLVAMNKEHDALLREPISSILSKAQDLSGRSLTDNLLEYDPYSGLCDEQPKRAYLALAHAAKRGDFPFWAWDTFLNSKSWQTGSPRFSAIVATRLCRIPDENLKSMLHSATSWLQKVAKTMSTEFQDVFDQIVQRFITVVENQPDIAPSALLGSNRGRDWVAESINSPVGHLVLAIFESARIEENEVFDKSLDRVEQCLSFPGDPRRHAIAIASHNLAWIYTKKSEWAETHLLSVLNSEDHEDQEAFWAGVFWNPRILIPALYMQVKDKLLNVAKTESSAREGHAESLGYLLLAGWELPNEDVGGRLIENSELRDVLLQGGDIIRSQVLWQFKRVLQREDLDVRKEWQQRACEFFNEVWPRQRSVKSSVMTSRLCEVLLAHPESFATLIDVVTPFLTKIHNAADFHFYLGEELKNLIRLHPERFLHLLYSVLPDDVRNWPYGIVDSLDLVTKIDPSLFEDSRLRELRHKWDSR